MMVMVTRGSGYVAHHFLVFEVGPNIQVWRPLEPYFPLDVPVVLVEGLHVAGHLLLLHAVDVRLHPVRHGEAGLLVRAAGGVRLPVLDQSPLTLPQADM